MEIVKANLNNLADVAQLFDAYRQFYDCPPDSELAIQFIKERMENSESDIFLALEEGLACGFVQLYPSFCSVQATKIYILYDLYVRESCRKAGIGEELMNKASQWAMANKATRLDLLTGNTNKIGQHLYEKLGYKRVHGDLYAYSLQLVSA